MFDIFMKCSSINLGMSNTEPLDLPVLRQCCNPNTTTLRHYNTATLRHNTTTLTFFRELPIWLGFIGKSRNLATFHSHISLGFQILIGNC